mgnify:CR=1 FL=1
MKQHLYTKLLILYFMLGGICFLLLSSGGSYLVVKKAGALYRRVPFTALPASWFPKNELRQAVKSPEKRIPLPGSFLCSSLSKCRFLGYGYRWERFDKHKPAVL